MKRMGAIPERCSTGRVVDAKKAEKWIGRRVRIHETVWAAGLGMVGKYWKDVESQVDAGTSGTIDFNNIGYVIRWDATADLRIGYTTLDHQQLKDLIKREVLQVIG